MMSHLKVLLRIWREDTERHILIILSKEYEEFMRIRPCSACHGQRLKPSSLAVTIADKNIYEITNMSIIKLQEFLENMKLSERQLFIGAEILKEIKARIKFLVDVGLGLSGTFACHRNSCQVVKHRESGLQHRLVQVL